MSGEEKVTCPDCDEEYSHLGIHWARSKECDYPVLNMHEEAVLDGLMFVGGSLNGRHKDSNCYVSIVQADRDALNWIDDQLGVLSNGVSEYDPAGTIEYHGGEKARDLWELRTRSLPALDKYYVWYDRDGHRTVPDDVTVRPLLLKTACLLAARPMTDRPGLFFSLRRTTPPPVAVHRIFGGYGPRIVRQSDGGYTVRIQNSTDLCNDLAPWPTFARDRFDAGQFREGDVVCPRCGGRFRRRTHLCETVEDGEVVRLEDANPGGSWEVVEVEGMRARIRTSDEEPPRLVSWRQEDCVQALLKEYGSAGRVPTNPEYQREQEGRPDLPSISTLYARFGDRDGWLSAMRAALADEPILDPAEDPPGSIIEKERRLYDYYGARLPEKQRRDVKAVIVDAESVPHRATKRGISRKVVYKNVRRGRERLRELARSDGVEWSPTEGDDYPFPSREGASGG
jgi:hypothetical protein